MNSEEQEHCRSTGEGGSINRGYHQSKLLTICLYGLHSTLTLVKRIELDLGQKRFRNETELPPLTSGNCVAGH